MKQVKFICSLGLIMAASLLAKSDRHLANNGAKLLAAIKATSTTGCVIITLPKTTPLATDLTERTNYALEIANSFKFAGWQVINGEVLKVISDYNGLILFGVTSDVQAMMNAILTNSKTASTSVSFNPKGLEFPTISDYLSVDDRIKYTSTCGWIYVGANQ